MFSVVLQGLFAGCSTPAADELCVLEKPIGDTEMNTSTTQTLSRSGSDFCQITSDGEVWIDGDKQGSIEPNGQIWIAGNREGSIETNGEVWKAGNKIGDVTSELEIWFDGNLVGEIESDGTVWRNGDAIGSTKGGNPRHAAIVFFYGFFE